MNFAVRQQQNLRENTIHIKWKRVIGDTWKPGENTPELNERKQVPLSRMSQHWDGALCPLQDCES
jgi:hypothetical protein